MEENQLRKKSQDRIQSPENLGEYIKVANFSMWMCLVAIVIFLIGGIIWCVFARLETKVDTALVVKDSKAKCYLLEEWQQYVNPDMVLRVDDVSYKLGEHNKEMEKLDVTNAEDEELLHVMGNEATGWYYVYDVDVDNLGDGIYKGVIVMDYVNPINFFMQ